MKTPQEEIANYNKLGWFFIAVFFAVMWGCSFLYTVVPEWAKNPLFFTSVLICAFAFFSVVGAIVGIHEEKKKIKPDDGGEK